MTAPAAQGVSRDALAAMTAPAAQGVSRDVLATSPGLLSRLRAGDLGPLPVIAGLLVIAAFFQVANPRFLSAQNLFNLSGQIAATGVIALGVVLVLLLGEIDLSVGSVSGVTSAAMVLLNVNSGWGAVPAIAAAIVFGVALGLLQGLIFTRLGVPSFVLTLGGLLTWQGLQLFLLRTEGTINIPSNNGIAKLANTNIGAVWGYVIAVSVAGAYLLTGVLTARRRKHAGLRHTSRGSVVARALFLAAMLALVTLVLQQWRGIPLTLLIFGSLVVFVDVVLRFTYLGRRVLAVGGNPEAARRAGVPVNLVRTGVFACCSALAACGGVLAASRLFSVSQSSGGSDILLNAIAAAVIGGTSLFGGRGTAYSALLGMLVIGSISNGMDLLNQSSAVKFMITGVVLVGAVVLDSLARRSRQTSGR